MALSLRDKILAADDLGREEVDCPEWGVKVAVRGLSLAERNRLAVAVGEDDLRATVAAVAMAAIDPKTGDPIFDAASDVEALEKKNAKVVDRLAQVIMRLSGFAPGKDSDDAAKN